jgi:hypothetical protein
MAKCGFSQYSEKTCVRISCNSSRGIPRPSNVFWSRI